MKIKKICWIAGSLAGLALITLGISLIFRLESGSSQSPKGYALREKGGDVDGQKRLGITPAKHMTKKKTDAPQKSAHSSKLTNQIFTGMDPVAVMKRERAEENRENLLALEQSQKEKRLQEALQLQIQQRHKKQAISRQFHQVARMRSYIARMRNELSQYEEDTQPRVQQQQMGRLFGQIDRVRGEITKQQKQIRSSDAPTSSQLALARSLDRDLNQLNQIQSNAKQQLTKSSRNRPRSLKGRDNDRVRSVGGDS